jgi:hypothetical protein
VTGRIRLEPEDWLEKKFEFQHPIGAFPSVVERVRGTPARLEELVRALPAEVLTTKPRDAWSIQEHVGHLFDLDALHEGRLDDFDAGLDVLRAADMTNRRTHEADHNSAHLDDLFLKFREARMRFVSRLEEMTEEQVARTALHPRLNKPMRVIDLALFVAEHDDHHLAGITQLARTLLD